MTRINRKKRSLPPSRDRSQVLRQLDAKVHKALTTPEREYADTVEVGEGYPDLIAGVEAQGAILWAAMTRGGLRNNTANKKLVALNTTILLQLVHNAYSLGHKYATTPRSTEEQVDETD